MRVHPRIKARHLEIDDADVEHAWEHYRLAAVRDAGMKEIRVGFDLKGRELEMVGALTADGWLVYHAFTPPTKKFIREIERGKGGR